MWWYPLFSSSSWRREEKRDKKKQVGLIIDHQDLVFRKGLEDALENWQHVEWVSTINSPLEPAFWYGNKVFLVSKWEWGNVDLL